MKITKAHGALNDVVLVPTASSSIGDSQSVARFVRDLCDRTGRVGADGVYFIDSRSTAATAEYFNSDGTSAEYCGNGLRCVGRWLMDSSADSTVEVVSGGVTFSVSEAQPSDGESRRVSVGSRLAIHPMRSAWDGEPIYGRAIPGLAEDLTFYGLAVPNPHIVALVDEFDEAQLTRVAEYVNSSPELFPQGVNVSFVLPVDMDGTDFFVRTFERGAGLTPSCASGATAAAVVLAMTSTVPWKVPMMIHNRGGVIEVRVYSTERGYFAEQTGNATFLEDFDLDLASLSVREDTLRSIESDAYDAFLAQRDVKLMRAGVLSAA